MGGRKPRIDMAFRVTDRELMAIKKAASSGLTIWAVKGYSSPAPRGIARVL
jgi:hypothetical protein